MPESDEVDDDLDELEYRVKKRVSLLDRYDESLLSPAALKPRASESETFEQFILNPE